MKQYDDAIDLTGTEATRPSLEDLKREAREATDRFFAEKLPAALKGIWALATSAEDEKVRLAALKQVKDHFQPKTTVPGLGGATFQILNYITGAGSA